MVSENTDLATEQQRMESGLNTTTPMVFQEETTLRFNCAPPPPQPPEPRHIIDTTAQKTREMSNFVGQKMFPDPRFFGTEFRRNEYDSSAVRENPNPNPNWNHDGSTDGSVGDDDDEEDDDEDDDDDEGVEEIGFVGGKNDNSSGSVHSSNDKDNLQKHNSSLGLSRGGMLAKEGNGVHLANDLRGSSSNQHHQQGRGDHYENAVAVVEPDLYYSQFLQGPDGSSLGQKEIGENGCGVSGGKEASLLVESGEPLRAILSDPITGTLMDDAMILPCGHSFGSGGLQHVIRMKACYTCSHSVTEDSFAPNLSLRYAIQAFRREEDLHSCRVSKRKRERLEQDKSSCGDLSMYISRGKGVQFPFAVTDRVVIKGNKRTPLRFVGREAVVTTQCLNGWYVVKTLDNAESVKLQYRSLAKVSDGPSSNMNPSKTTPSWL